jgi:putative aldouronate transport system substrate-binding protein
MEYNLVNKNMMRFLVLFLCFTVIVPTFAQEPVAWTISETPLIDEPITLKIVAQKAGPLTPNFDEMVLMQWAEQQTNVKIEWTNIANADYQERKNLILASGDLPDAFWNTGFNDFDIITYGQSGVLIPLEDLIEQHAPNLKKIFEQRPEVKQAVTAPDGHIYTLPFATEMNIGAVPFFYSINKSWLDKLGLAEPATLQELHDVLLAFKTQDPNGNGQADEIPFSFMFNWWCADIGDFFGAFGMPDNAQHRIVRDGKVIFTAVQPEYKEAINYFHSWVEEGLIDPESFTQDVQTYLAKGKTGDASILGSYIWWETEEVVGPSRADQYKLLAPVAGPTGIRGIGHSNGSEYGRSAFAITSVNQYPELTMQWIDLFYNPYVSAQVIWGPVGVIYEQNEQGMLVNLPLPEGVSMGEFRQTVAPEGVGVILREDFGTVVDMEPRAKQRVTDLEAIYKPFAEDEFYPSVFFTQEELDELNVIEVEITNFVNQKRAQWLAQGGINEEWDSYLTQLEAMGLSRMMAIYQAALDRFNASK